MSNQKAMSVINRSAELAAPVSAIEDPISSFGYVISDISRMMRRNFDRKAQQLGLTRAQWLIILHLRRRAGMRQIDLAELMEIQPITLARQIDRMEAKGWVIRRNDPEDRRAKRLFLTTRIEPLLKDMQAIGKIVVDKALRGIPTEEYRIALEVLTRVRVNLGDNTQLQEPDNE